MPALLLVLLALFVALGAPAARAADGMSCRRGIVSVGDSRLELGYAGFSPSSASKTCYYRLSVPGGTSGISDGAGGSMEADLWLVMCAE